MTARSYPDHVIKIGIKPKRQEDRDRLLVMLGKMSASDGGLRIDTDPDADELIIHGQSEMHLDGVFHSIASLGIELKIGPPVVGYLGVPSISCTIDYTHKKFFAGIGEFARLIIRIEPNAPEDGNRIKILANQAELPVRFHEDVRKGLETVLNSGPNMGIPFVETLVTVSEAAFHETDSSGHAFQIAARMAIREGLQKSKGHILEPRMKLAVEVPGALAMVVPSRLRQRLAYDITTAATNSRCLIEALVPLANMFGYSNELKSLAQGSSATFELSYSHHELLPSSGDPENFPQAMALRH